MADAARVGDHAQSPNSLGMAIKGSDNVEINGRPAVRRCDQGIGLSGPCFFQKWVPVMGSSTVEVNGKPLVRKDDETQHFACGPGVMIDGSPKVVGGVAGTTTDTVSIDELVHYIYEEMMRNKDDPRTQRIKLNNDMFRSSMEPIPFSMSPPFPDWGSFYRAMDQWKDLVGYGKPWDHKPYILQNFGQTAYDPASNTSLTFDTWSNIHYGFVGRAAGFDGGTLKDGAGLAQWLNDHPDASDLVKAGKYAEFLGGGTGQYDHPEDQQAIQIGVDLWEKYKKTGTLTEADVKEAVLKAMGPLGGVTGHMC